jgi:hypothetical protein
MTVRTDIHRPAVIEPKDYEFIKFDYLPSSGDVLGDAEFLAAERARFRAHMEMTGGRFSHHEHGGSCHICGAGAVYTATFWHKPSNVYIHTGLECASKLECSGVEAFRREVKRGLEATAGKRKAKATLEAAGMSGAWDVYLATDKKWADYRVAYEEWRKANPEPEMVSVDGYYCEEVGAPKVVANSWAVNTVLDIVGKLIRYGSISEKQMAFVGKLVDQIAREPEIAAARAAEAEAAMPVPVCDKRMTVKGTVLTVKAPEEGARFPSYKMLVRHADGWKVWGTVPSSVLDEIERGDEIEFVASVKVSDRDPKFGFASRPGKAKLIKAAKEEVAA